METAERVWPSLAGTGSCRFFANPQFHLVTFGIIPAFISEFHTVLSPNVVGLSSIPILPKSAKTIHNYTKQTQEKPAALLYMRDIYRSIYVSLRKKSEKLPHSQ